MTIVTVLTSCVAKNVSLLSHWLEIKHEILPKNFFGWKLWNTLLVVEFEFKNWFLPNLENELWKKELKKFVTLASVRDLGERLRETQTKLRWN